MDRGAWWVTVHGSQRVTNALFFFLIFILIPEPVSITLHGKWDTVM